jgi:hypothetical protein
LNDDRRVHQARIEEHEPGKELVGRREIPVLRARIRKPLIEKRPIKPTNVRGFPVPLLQPPK